MENKHVLTEIVQSAVIVANNKLLILSLWKYPDKWVFPGWRMNEWEYWKEWLKREVKEEIWLDNINVINIITVNNRKTKDTNQFGIYYYCTCNNTQVILSDEHNDYKWISNIQELNNNKNKMLD